MEQTGADVLILLVVNGDDITYLCRAIDAGNSLAINQRMQPG